MSCDKQIYKVDYTGKKRTEEDITFEIVCDLKRIIFIKKDLSCNRIVWIGLRKRPLFFSSIFPPSFYFPFNTQKLFCVP